MESTEHASLHQAMMVSRDILPMASKIAVIQCNIFSPLPLAQGDTSKEEATSKIRGW